MMQIQGKACMISDVKSLKVQDHSWDYDENQVVVKVERGGICGSDLHYYQHGGISDDYKLKHPMVLGHEAVGHVHVAPATSALYVGQKVAINPSRPCRQCSFCLQGAANHCSDMRFFGSAMRVPHVHGAFAEYRVVDEEQCVPYHRVSADVMCFAEPLSVGIHAVNQAGSLVGRHVLVSGAGPIGCLIVAAVQASGADSVTVFDISARSRELATAMGATRVCDPLDAAEVELFRQNKGFFDVAFETSGAPSAVELATAVVRPGGTIVQVGMTPKPVAFPMMTLITKEINWVGSFRFAGEFASAVNWLDSGRINPLPLLSATYHFTDIEAAILAAGDKTKSAKIQISF